MITISLCMIVKDEEKVIARCLDSVSSIVDEIIIVDTGSKDATKEIVKSYTNEIYDFPWNDDFAEARNFAFTKASKDYTLWLDADDVVLPEDQQKFSNLKRTLDRSVDSVQMKYVLGKSKDGLITSSLTRNRLLKTANKFKWVGAVHEYVEAAGKIMTSDICITHQSIKESKTERNLNIYQKMLAMGRAFTPRDLFYYGNECFEHGLYEEAIEQYSQFLQTGQGWFNDCIRACSQGAQAWIMLGNSHEAVSWILRSFAYDIPRADLCCKLAYLFLEQENYEQAVYWYKAALEDDPERVSALGGLVEYAYYTWLPHLQLCVCCDKLKKYEQAYYHNEMAGVFNPKHASVIHNRNYLETVLYKN